jgi:pilus assembly protein CpaB
MQNQRGLLFLGIAVLFGLAAAFVAQRWLSGQEPAEPQAAETTSVVVARIDLPVATELSDRQLVTVDWPTAHLPKGIMTRVERAQDRVLRHPLVEGEPLLESALFPEGSEAGLTAVIAPNRRAVSVKVDPVVGVAGFVKPGTRVDVLTTLRRVDRQKPVPYSKVILQDVRVLAVDQKLEEARNGEPEIVSVVTLEVEPVQAEQLTYASHEGRLQLALRNPADKETVETVSVGVADLLGRKRAGGPRVARSTTSVQVIKGSKVQVKEF